MTNGQSPTPAPTAGIDALIAAFESRFEASVGDDHAKTNLQLATVLYGELQELLKEENAAKGIIAESGDENDRDSRDNSGEGSSWYWLSRLGRLIQIYRKSKDAVGGEIVIGPPTART